MVVAPEVNTARSAADSFGRLLRAYRRSARLTQEQLAERAGYSTVYVSMLERDQRTPLPATADALAEALSLSPRDRAALQRAARSGAPGSQDGETALVGRARELELIERLLTGGGPPVLTLAGEPGIGKTALLREAALRAGLHAHSVLEGGCLRRGGQEPYAPVVGALQSYMRSRDAPQLRRELAGCAWLTRLLPELAGGPIEPLPGWTIPPEQERRLIDEAVVRFLTQVAGPAGTLLVLDDLQWAGGDALDLIGVLVHSAAPIRILFAYRDNEITRRHPLSALLADLAHRGLVAHHTLGPLTEQEAGALLAGLLDGLTAADPTTGRAAEVQEQVLRRAEGVPFFVVSCAQAMRSGALTPAGGGIPWDVTQSIQQRVAALPQSAQDVLDWASIVGRRVPPALLAVMGEEASVVAGLQAACRARLLEEDAGGAYQFTHDVVREVIEADLGAARRAMLHRQIGAELERRGAPVETLAYHHVRSGDDDKAVEYLERAGEKTEAQHANTTAEGYYRELVDWLDRLQRVRKAAEARERLGRVLRTAARYDASLEVLEQAARAFRGVGDLEGEARAVAEIGRVHSLKGTPEEGIARIEPIRALLAGSAPSRALAALDLALAPLYLACNRYREQLEAAEQAAEIARDLGEDRMVAEAEVWRGCALNQIGRLEEGHRVQQAAIPLAEAARDLGSLSHALNDIGFLSEIQGQFAQSRVYKKRALEVAEQAGDPAATANMAFRCGQNTFLSGEWDLARQYFDRSVATASRVDALSILAYPLFGLGLLALLEGDGDAAVARADQCLAIARKANDAQILRAAESLLAEKELQDGRPHDALIRLSALEPEESGLSLHSALPALAVACLRVGDIDAAQAHTAAAVRWARERHNLLGLADLLPVQALVLIERQQWSEVRDALEEGLRLARPMPYPYAEARLLSVYGILHHRLGERAQAEDKLLHALRIFQRLGARPDATLTTEAITALNATRP